MDGVSASSLGERLDLAENPLPSYAKLRSDASVVPNDGIVPMPTTWVATSRDSIMAIFRDPEVFSSANVGSGLSDRPLIPLEIDPPEHRHYRQLLDPFFSPRQLRPLEGALRAQINNFIDGFIDRGQVDLLAEFFEPYPTQVFLTMYGLPLEDRAQFLQWKEDMTRGGNLDEQAKIDAVAAFYAYMDSYLDHAGGGDDLLSQLIASDLTRDEILSISHLFLLAGLDTVTSALCGAFCYLAKHPEVRQQIVDQPEIIPEAVEELLRIGTPAPALSRRVTRDVELDGVQLRGGQTVYCHLGAANGDEATVPHAEQVDLTRRGNRHASFGLGPHRCLGSHLARLEVRLVLEEFHRRIPHYEVAPSADLFRVPFFE
jgi:cytochrome P450